MKLPIAIGAVLLVIAGLSCSQQAASVPKKSALDDSPPKAAATDAEESDESKTPDGGPKLIGPGVVAPGSPEAVQPTHVISVATEYYTTGPQQGRPPDGTLPEGTKVTILEAAGSYSRIRTADGIEAYVATDALKPLDKTP